MEDSPHTIERALTALTDRDMDYASQQNGRGWNGTDTVFGHSLADQVRAGKRLSYRQRAAAHRMLRKYANQLRGCGIEYELIAPPTEDPVTEAPKRERTVTIVGSEAIFASEYHAGIVDAIKTAFPLRKWVKADKTWKAQVDAATAQSVRDISANFGFTITNPDALDAIEQAGAANIEASQSADGQVDIPGFGSETLTLYPFQHAGVSYATKNRKLIIGDEMGLGKTPMALGTIQSLDAFPALVICPAVVSLNWVREAERWLPGRTVARIGGQSDPIPETDIIVTTYGLATKAAERLAERPFRSLVCDESHFIKGKDAQRTKAAQRLAQDRDVVLLLTGTPLPNRPSELVEQLRTIGHLKDFGGEWRFKNRYCLGTQTPWGNSYDGCHHPEELNMRLRERCYVRRTKDQVLTELPPKRRVVVPLDMDDRVGYEAIERDLRRWFREQADRDAEFLASLEGLDPDEAEAIKQAYVEARDARARAAEALVRIGACKRAASRRKVRGVCEWVQNFLDTGKKLILFAHHKDIIAEVALKFEAPTITGATSPENRQAAVDRFQTDPDCRLIVCNMTAAGVGITLTAASDVAFIELPWRPGDLDQAEDRAHRIGQAESVTCWYLLADRTIEVTISELLDSKRVVVEAVTDGRSRTAEGIMGALAKALLREDGE